MLNAKTLHDLRNDEANLSGQELYDRVKEVKKNIGWLRINIYLSHRNAEKLYSHVFDKPLKLQANDGFKLTDNINIVILQK